MSRLVKVTLWALGSLFFVLFLGLAVLWWLLNASQAQLSGTVYTDNVSQTTVIERDEQGLITISGETRADIAYALGYSHAQERLFQMDLLRRNSAGELSELFGAIALNVDKNIRIHQFRKRAQRAVAKLTPDHLQLLISYADGVNAGKAALRILPFEYLLLQAPFEDWEAADSFLVVYSMYMDLQDEWGEMERSLSAMHDLLPEDWFAFLTPNGGQWDAPIDGQNFTFDAALPQKPLADFIVGNSQNAQSNLPQYYDEILPGSNNWSVAGSMTEYGNALVADDMHLGLRVPNIWFRASWYLPEDGRRITGASLPGAPLMVIGSNEHIAWGFTNSYGDYSDLIALQTRDDSEYLTPDGWQSFIDEEEVVQVKDGAAQKTIVRKTIWGPVIGKDHNGNDLVMRWVAHDPSGLNLKLIEMEQVNTAQQAIQVAAQTGVPGQNLNVGDRDGNIGWTILGVLPQRKGISAGVEQRLISDWSDGKRGWDGLLPVPLYPAVLNPIQQRLWTANARIVSDGKYANMGDGLGALGARQQQIRDRLFEKDQFNEMDFLDIHLDDEARFLLRWQQLLVSTLSDDVMAAYPELASFQSHVNDWQGRASADSVGYLLVKRYRERVIDQTVGHVFRYVADQTEHFWAGKVDNKVEYAVWQLITEQPENHLPIGYEHWADFLQTMAAELNNELIDAKTGLVEQTWGAHNRLKITHPMSSSVPLIGKILDMPSLPMAGDTFMPRVQGKSFGASQRMTVSPGREAQGYFHMATGQSAHPLSPFYGNGHEDWVKGTPSPFLPGETKYRLELVPQ